MLTRCEKVSFTITINIGACVETLLLPFCTVCAAITLRPNDFNICTYVLSKSSIVTKKSSIFGFNFKDLFEDRYMHLVWYNGLFISLLLTVPYFNTSSLVDVNIGKGIISFHNIHIYFPPNK